MKGVAVPEGVNQETAPPTTYTGFVSVRGLTRSCQHITGTKKKNCIMSHPTLNCLNISSDDITRKSRKALHTLHSAQQSKSNDYFLQLLQMIQYLHIRQTVLYV